MKCKWICLFALLCLLPVMALAEIHTVENDVLTLTLDDTNLAITVTDKASGQTMTTVTDTTKDWGGRLTSTLIVEVTEGTAMKAKVYTMTKSANTIAVTDAENGFDAVVDFTDIGQRITLNIRLEGDSFRVTVPKDGVEEYGATNLCGIYLAPCLGAARLEDKNGYLFVPEAAGAIIAFRDGERDMTAYSKRVYGTNIGVDNLVATDMVRPEEDITLPVYGMAYTDEQLGYLAVLEDGAEASYITAYYAGTVNNVTHNWVENRFVLREEYQAQVSRAQGLPRREGKAYLRDMTVRFYILSGEEASYSGMARRYRQSLLESGQLVQKDASYRPRIDFLMAESVDFLLWNSVEMMTTVSQAEEIVDTYLAQGLTSPVVLLRGWQPGGLTNALGSGSVRMEGKVGSEGDVRSLTEKLRAHGGKVFLEIDLTLANPERRYNMGTDVVRTLGQAVATEATGEELYPTMYYLTPRRSADVLTDLTDRWADSVDGVALMTTPNRLYSYYTRSGNQMRGDTRQDYQSMMEESALPLMLDNPLDSYFHTMEAYLNLPMNGSGYQAITAEVPFIPMVLSGQVPVYSTWLNQDSDARRSLLKLVEYGTYPSFLVTGEDVQPLIHTNSSSIFTAQWNVLQKRILETDAALRELYAAIDGAAMVDHEVLATNVARVTYANGMQVIVNYRRAPYTLDGVTVPAMDYLLVKGGAAQ